MFFFVISPIKLKQYWRNLVHRFLSKFAAKWHKCFLPYLNNVSTVRCETWNAHCACAMCHCYQKKLQPWSTNSLDLNPVDNSMSEILQEVYKTLVIDLELPTMPLTNSCHNDDINQLGSLHSQSLFQFVQIMNTYFYTISCNIPHMLSIWRIWRPQLRCDKFWSFFLLQLNGSTCLTSISSFTR